jgi:TatA/E family protein of Tat protein translocase
VSGFGWQELLIILAIFLLIFGSTRLPSLARSMGSSIRGFKRGLEEGEPDEQPAVAEATANEESKPATTDAVAAVVAVEPKPAEVA